MAYNTIQVKRGLQANRLNVTPLAGEFLFTTDDKQLYIGDGTTEGGINILSSVTSMLGTAAQLDTGTAAGDIPVIGSNGKIDASLIPALAITDVFFAASQAEMVALAAAGTGDVCIRTDTNTTYILSGTNSAVASDWTMLLTPTDTVLSVNGKVGVVVLDKADIGLSNVENKSASEILANATLTGTATAPTVAAADDSDKIATTAWVRDYAEANFMVIGQAIDAGTF